MKINAVVIMRCDGEERRIGFKECTDFMEERDTDDVVRPGGGGEVCVELTGRGSIQLLHGVVMTEEEVAAFLKTQKE